MNLARTVRISGDGGPEGRHLPGKTQTVAGVGEREREDAGAGRRWQGYRRPLVHRGPQREDDARPRGLRTGAPL